MSETNLYCHDEDGDTFKVIDTSSFTESEVIYYLSGNGVIYTGITDDTIFEFDQDLAYSDADIWTIWFNTKITGTSVGYSAFISFYIYRVEPDDTEHLLFIADKQGVFTFYSPTGYYVNIIPSDYIPYWSTKVYKGDRLKIVVNIGQRLPS